MDSFSSAVDYAQRYGFSCFPAYGIVAKHGMDGLQKLVCSCGNIACSSPGKHPAISKGLNAASKDPAVLENLWAGRPNLNIGIATGVISGIFVVDVDGEAGRVSLSELPPLPPTLTCRTARGHHYYFKYPDRKVFNRTHVWRNIDIRGDGGYVVAAPSNHIEGISYEWLDPNASISVAPQWLIDKVCADKKAPIVHDELLEHAADRDWSTDEVRDMLSYIDSSCGNDEWVAIGMALRSGNYDFGLWDEWSKSSHKYKAGEANIRWRSFKPDGGITMGTLVGEAKLRGWKPREYISEPIDWESHPARAFAVKMGIYTPPRTNEPESNVVPIVQENNERWPTPLTFDPYKMEGLVGETVRWICDCAVIVQPEMALLTVLSCLGAIFGRKFTGPTGVRTNLYCVSVAGSTSGKDHARKCMGNLMVSAGLDTFLAGGRIISTSGLITQVERQPSHVMMIDEFGLVLKAITGEKAAGYLADVAAILLDLFTSSDNMAWRNGTYGDKKIEPVVVHEPNMCIYGTTTLDTYLDALKKIAITSGQMNRFIVLPGREEPESRDDDLTRVVPDELVEKWRNLVIGGLENANKNIILSRPKIARWGDNAKDFDRKIFQTQKICVKNKVGGNEVLWGRLREMVLKVALIFSLVDDINNPVITITHMALAEKIVKASCEYISDLASNFMYENDQEKKKRDVMVLIRNYGGNGIHRTELLRKTGNLKARELDDIMRGLIEEERVSSEQEKTSTRNRIIYKAI